MATHRYFERSWEILSADELRATQWSRFRRLLSEAWERNRFYRRKLDAVGLHPDDVREPGDLRHVPVTTKEELVRDVEECPPYGSRLQVPPSEIVNVVETSGTSGKGRETHPQTAGDLEAIYRAEAYGFVWAGVTTGTVVVLTWPVTMTAGSSWWLYTLGRLGANVLRIGHLGAEEKLGYLRRYGATVFVATPSYVTRLERAAEAIGLDPRQDLGVRRIIVAGEGRPVEWAAHVEAVWGARLSEQWGCTQGALAWTCEEGLLRGGQLGLMHTLPHLCLTEVVDRDTGRHVPSGEYGEIVVTPLHGEAAPLIRFATNDRARFLASDRCPCGRPFDGLACGSVSRYDDMIKVKGVNVWASAIAGVVMAYPAVREHRAQVSLDAAAQERALLELELVAGVDGPARAELLATIAARLARDVGVRFDVREWQGPGLLEAATLDRNTGKARRWIDRRGEHRTGS
jgi:phenylacetate-CoA ligase